MEIVLEKQDAVNASLKINLQEEDYRQKVADKLKLFGKKAQIKGFRVGKVPPALVNKLYGKSILAEEINEVLSSSISDYIKNNQIDILGEPIPAETSPLIDWDNQKNFEFVFNVGLAPAFDCTLSGNIRLTRYHINFDETVLEETIQNLKKQFGEYTDADTVSEEDILVGKGTDSNARIYEIYLPVNRILDLSKATFLNATKGQTVTFDVRQTLEDDAAIAYVLGIDKKIAPKVQGNIDFTIEKIHHQAEATLNEDFYFKVFRNKEVTTEEQFREKLKENIRENYDQQSKNKLYSDVYNYLMENTSIELPSDFLKKWIELTNNPKLTPLEIEEQFPSFEKGLKWNLIRDKIALEYHLEVANEDVLDRARQTVARTYGIQGELTEETSKLLDVFANNLLEKDNGKEYKKLFDELYVENILETVIKHADISEKQIDIKDFNQLG